MFYESEIADLRSGKFFLDAAEITLTGRSNGDHFYRGPGFIRQTEDGELEYRLYDSRRETTFPLRWQAGGVIPDRDFYDLKLIDYSGRSWEASRTLVNTSGTIGNNACVCKGKVFEITCVEDVSPSEELWLFFPGVIKIPTNAGTSVIERQLTAENLRFDPNLWTFKGDRFQILVTKADDGIEVRVRPANEPLPRHLPKCIEEVVWFVLAVPAYAQLISWRGVGGTRFSIREARQIPASTRFRPPLEPDHGDSAEHLGDLFLRYLEHVLPRTEETYHPTSVNILSVLRAASITLDSLALALSVAIESVVRRELAECGKPDEDILMELDSAMAYLSRWDSYGPAKSRITQAINTWKGSSARDALKNLCAKGVITAEQLTAWNSIRHPMAHGQPREMNAEQLLHFCDLQHMAFIRLLFQVLGYTGPYTDRSVEGWPRAEFTCVNLSSRVEITAITR
jgi:hypothetical protein